MTRPHLAKFLCLTLLIFLASLATAQTYLGVKVGWNHNFAKYDSDFKTDQSLSGWHVGLYSQFTIGEKLYLIPELQFSTRNYRLNSFLNDLHFGYIEIPILLSWTQQNGLIWKQVPISALKSLIIPIPGSW